MHFQHPGYPALVIQLNFDPFTLKILVLPADTFAKAFHFKIMEQTMLLNGLALKSLLLAETCLTSSQLQ